MKTENNATENIIFKDKSNAFNLGFIKLTYFSKVFLYFNIYDITVLNSPSLILTKDVLVSPILFI